MAVWGAAAERDVGDRAGVGNSSGLGTDDEHVDPTVPLWDLITYSRSIY